MNTPGTVLFTLAPARFGPMPAVAVDSRCGLAVRDEVSTTRPASACDRECKMRDSRAAPRREPVYLASKRAGPAPLLRRCLGPAQEISGLGGALRGQDRAHTFSWEMDYQRNLAEHASFSAGWINEGHVPGHHRDGAVAEIWWRTTAFDQRLTLAAGVGPYAYFDTVPTTDGDGSHDDHGIGIIVCAAATWQVEGPLSLQLRFNRVGTKQSVDSSSVLLGAVYRLDGVATPSDSAGIQPAFDSEVDLLFGRTIVNTLASEDSFAAQIEYRRRIGPYWAWSAGLLNEGDANTQRRSGVLAEFWAGHEFLDRRVTAAIGIGPYVVLDIRKNPQLVRGAIA